MYIVIWMIIYWVTEALPIPVTAFLPVILFPMFGIMSAQSVAQSYLPVSHYWYYTVNMPLNYFGTRYNVFFCVSS